MSWVSNNGRHEGYVAPVFADGRMGGGSSAEGVSITMTADGRRLPYDEWETVPESQIVGWVTACSCADVPDRVGWLGFRWSRVATAEEEDVFAGRLYVADYQDAAFPEDAGGRRGHRPGLLARPRGP